MSREITYRCDICGNIYGNDGYVQRIRRLVFHVEIDYRAQYICNECYEQLKELRKANIMAERKEE